MGDVFAVYFSPTGNTAKCVCALAKGIAEELNGGDFFKIDLTAFEDRIGVYGFGEDDIVVLGVPTYAGRVPNKILPYLQESVWAEGAYAVGLVTFGNRSMDDSLKELCITMEENDFRLVGAVSAVTEHAFATGPAAGRPNEDDLKWLEEEGRKYAEKIRNFAGKTLNIASIPGHEPEQMVYYTPKKPDGTPAVFLKAKPVTDESRCSGCGACRAICPMNCYKNSVTEPEGTCIKCQACIAVCPGKAKEFTDEEFLAHRQMLEKNYSGIEREYRAY